MASVLAYTGLANQVVEIEEAAASSALDWYDGDLVKNDTSGELVIATAGAILGIARKNAVGVDGSKIPVELLNINEIYVAVYTSSATAESLIGDLLDFTFTVGAHTLDESGATTDVYCVGLKDPAATTSGRLLVRFLGTLFTATAT